MSDTDPRSMVYLSGMDVKFEAEGPCVVLEVDGKRENVKFSEALKLQAQLAQALLLTSEEAARMVSGSLVTPDDVAWDQTLAKVDLKDA
jgi:hypothetical protein